VTDRYDVVVVGAGIVGLATALALLERKPLLSLAVIEKEADVGLHQSSHNSGVLHSGIYYSPGSLKATLCKEGKARLEAFAEEHGLAYERCGKLIVAIDESELPRLAELARRAEANGVRDVREVNAAEMRDIEPHVTGIRALHVPGTAIIDYAAVTRAYATEARSRGATILLGCRFTGTTVRTEGSVVHTDGVELMAKHLITCAGLHADRCAASVSALRDTRTVPFRGDYYTLAPVARNLVRGLIYPVPDPSLPFLGVHFTRRIDGEVWAGPNAVLALAREGYRRTHVRPVDMATMLAFPGFWRMARKNWRVGAAELWRDVAKYAYVRELQRYIPAVTADQLQFGPSGVRAQAVDRAGALIDDFVLSTSTDAMHVVNAPSPAATASLAIGARLADEAITAFAL
jgi:(S)-2-hydroxyglutarate dehydrogenase